MATNPPGSWPDQAAPDAKPSTLDTRPRQPEPEKALKPKRKALPTDKPTEKSNSKKRVELPLDILEQ